MEQLSQLFLAAAKAQPIIIIVGDTVNKLSTWSKDNFRLIEFTDAPHFIDFLRVAVCDNKHKFDVPVGVIDFSGEITADLIEALNNMFSTVVFSSGGGFNDFLAVFNEQAIDFYRLSEQSIARKARMLAASSYSLRVENERLRTSIYELSRALDNAPKLVVTHTIAPPSGLSINLYPLNEAKTIIQNIFKPSRGFCGFDLHFPYPPPNRRGDVYVLLRSGDNSDILAEWVFDLSKVYGWLHFPLSTPLMEGITSLKVELISFGWGEPSVAEDMTGKISAASNVISIDGNAIVDGTACEGLSLALRIWTGPPGKLLPYSYSINAESINDSVSNEGYFLPISIKEEDIECTEELFINKSNSNEVEIEACGQLSNSHINFYKIIPSRTVRIYGKIVNTGSCGLLVNVDVYGTKSPASIDYENEKDDNISRALFVGSGSTAPFDVDIPRGELAHDLRVVIRTLPQDKNNLKIIIKDLRGVWDPLCAKPLILDRFAIENLFTKQEMTVNKARREFRKSGNKIPTIELLCPIHRIEDAGRLKQTIDRLVNEVCGAVIILHGDSDFQGEIRRAIGSKPNVRYITFSRERNLGYILNRACETSIADYLIKIDADDIYFENFASDLVIMSILSNATIVGKSQFGLLFEDEDELCYFSIDKTQGFVEQIAGGTICFKRQIFERVMFNETLARGTDKVFLLDAQASGARIYTSDGMNYVHTRGRDVNRHTWNNSNEEFRTADYRLIGSGRDVELFRV